MTEYEQILQQFAPITLQQMESVKLMNRIDTKYVVTIRQLPVILSMAKTDYYAQDINGVRLATYDTVYYDTDGLDMYLRHHDRQLVRQKIRVRRYVDTDLTFLEIKRKNNKGRTKKKRIEVPGFNLTGGIIGKGKTDITVEDFVAAKSRYTWDAISPKLRTAFRRITLVNKAMTERLTIDLDLSWDNRVTGLGKSYSDLVIVELKRDGNVPSPMLHIMQTLRIHPLKISKYCVGTALTTPFLKQNRFKGKIRRIEKLLSDT